MELYQLIINQAANALDEDVGSGDISAALIDADCRLETELLVREDAILCGCQWFDEVFRQCDAQINIRWFANDGDAVAADSVVCEVSGPARGLLTAERSAINFLQTLSGTATISAYYASLVEGTGVKLLDTRKTIPGLRRAQKYAVSCGQCYNHRIGLYDAFLIKENHIMACGSIANAVATAKQNEPDKAVEVEVESFDELQQALDANADIVMLDNFDHAGLRLAVQKNRQHPTPAKLEASGGIDQSTLRSIAETGVDYISIGLLTKDCKAVDLSMRFV